MSASSYGSTLNALFKALLGGSQEFVWGKDLTWTSSLEVELVMIRLPRRETTSIILVVAVVLGSCQTGQNERVQDPFVASGPEQSEEVLLTVENNDFRDANIFAFWDGVRDRVGFVTGKTSRTFRMKWRSERVQIGVDFVGRGGQRSGNVDVWPGDHLNYVIMIGR